MALFNIGGKRIGSASVGATGALTKARSRLSNRGIGNRFGLQGSSRANFMQAQQNFFDSRANRSGGGGGAPSSTDSLQDYLNKANEANEARYQEGLGLHDQAMGEIDSLGAFDRERIAREQQQGTAADTQSMVSRGLYNTTVLDAAKRGRDADASFQNMGLSESLARQRAGARYQKAGFIERRNDIPPDLALFAQLQQNAAGAPDPRMAQLQMLMAMRGGGGSGGGGGGGANRMGYQQSSMADRYRAERAQNRLPMSPVSARPYSAMRQQPGSLTAAMQRGQMNVNSSNSSPIPAWLRNQQSGNSAAAPRATGNNPFDREMDRQRAERRNDSMELIGGY